MSGWSTDAGLWYALAYFGYSFAIFAHCNVAYLRRAAPWRGAWWVPLIQIIFPIQLLTALLSRQRIVWRGHVMQAERGGGFHFVRRRSDNLDPRRNAKEREE